MAPKRILPRAKLTFRRTSAGSATSIAKIRTKSSGANCPRIPGRRASASPAGPGEGHKILFSGGTASLHNFKGLDADGKPAELSPLSFALNLHGNKWETVSEDTFDVRTDARAIVPTPIGAMVVGGMVSNHAVTARAMLLAKK